MIALGYAPIWLVAQRLCIHVSTVGRQIKSGAYPSITHGTGKRPRIFVEIQALIEAYGQESAKLLGLQNMKETENGSIS